ncbi:MAG: TadE family protein, partial [Chloroflexota bacterium]
MTETIPEVSRLLRQPKGQTIIEFVMTLPVILVLLFGIIEFGRIFQAWIGVQNASRVAARYASTGQFESAYGDLILPQSLEQGAEDSFSIVPCDNNTVGGGLAPYYYDRDQEYAVLAPANAGGAGENTERLFTMMWGKNCVPLAETQDGRQSASADQQLRTDLLRIPSIYAAASEAAGGLAVRPIPVDNIISPTYVHDPNNDVAIEVEANLAEQRLWYFFSSTWHPKYPQFMLPTARNDLDIIAPQPVVNVETMTHTEAGLPSANPDQVVGPGLLNGYFSVMVCSSRAAGPGYENQVEETQKRISTEGRYVTVFSATEFEPEDYGNAPAGASTEDVARAAVDRANAEALHNLLNEGGTLYNRFTDMPGCFLNIERQPGDQWTRWLDAGGPGDRVDVAVSFYHPLITPLGLAEFIPIHGRRSARVEAFRSANAPVGEANSAEGGGGLLPVVTPFPTEPPPPTDVTPPTEPPPPTQTPTASPVPEELMFDCDLIEFVSIDLNAVDEENQKISFQPDSVTFLIRNRNNTPAILRSVDFRWTRPNYDPNDPDSDPVPGYGTFHIDRF